MSFCALFFLVAIAHIIEISFVLPTKQPNSRKSMDGKSLKIPKG